MIDQPSDRNFNRSVTGLPMNHIGVPLQAAIDAGSASDAPEDTEVVIADLIEENRELSESIAILRADMKKCVSDGRKMATDLYHAKKTLDELFDLCPRMSEDDPIAPAIADCLKRYKAAQS